MSLHEAEVFHAGDHHINKLPPLQSKASEPSRSFNVHQIQGLADVPSRKAQLRDASGTALDGIPEELFSHSPSLYKVRDGTTEGSHRMRAHARRCRDASEAQHNLCRCNG